MQKRQEYPDVEARFGNCFIVLQLQVGLTTDTAAAIAQMMYRFAAVWAPESVSRQCACDHANNADQSL